MAVSVGLGSRMASAVDYPVTGAPRIANLLVDARFDDANRIARAAAIPGLDIIALPRDVLEIWYDQLKPALDVATQTLAGVTTERGFFVLRTLAADHRLVVRFAATHYGPRDGRIAHRLEGPMALLTHCQHLSTLAPWQSVFGSAIRSCSAGLAKSLEFQSVASDARRDEALVSWVIGPAASRA